MKRRTLSTEGTVNFPVSSVTNTNEGGMFVQLWVTDDHLEYDKQYGLCCGTRFTFEPQECYVGADTSQSEFHYAFISEKGMSCMLIANILMGSTGWSNSDFICTYDDLNDIGKSIYNNIKQMYPDAKLHLVTFLDT